MSATRNHLRIGVLAAIGVILILSGLLAIRLFSASGAHAGTPPPGEVPAAKTIDIKKLSLYCWSCPKANETALDFHTDLDLLAPLGTGTANAATWFVDFAKPDRPRAAEG